MRRYGACLCVPRDTARVMQILQHERRKLGIELAELDAAQVGIPFMLSFGVFPLVGSFSGTADWSKLSCRGASATGDPGSTWDARDLTGIQNKSKNPPLPEEAAFYGIAGPVPGGRCDSAAGRALGWTLEIHAYCTYAEPTLL